MKFLQLQFDNVKQENTRIDEQITNINHQSKQYQNQMEVCYFVKHDLKEIRIPQT